MTKIRMWLFLLSVALVLPSADAKTLRVVLDENYPPYAFRDQQGRVQGYAVDLWHLWAKKTGIPVQITSTNWADAQATLLAGHADVIDMIFFTASRRASYDFTTPFARVTAGIYTDTGLAGIADVRTLRSFKVGVQAGDACAEKLRSSGVKEIRAYKNYAELIAEIQKGRLRVACIDNYPAQFYLSQTSAPGSLIKAFDFFTENFRRAVRKGDTATLHLVSRGMDNITESEKDALEKKWFGQTIIDPIITRKVIEAAAVIAIFFFFLAAWLKSTQRAVRRRTEELEAEKAQLKSLVENSSDYIWLKDESGVYTLCNGAAASLVGMRVDEIIGKTDVDLFSPSHADELRGTDRQALTTEGALSVQKQMTCAADGSIRHLDVVKRMIRGPDRRILGVLGVARDLTERRAQQDLIAKQSDILADMSHIAKIGGWEIDIENGLVYWTDEVAEIHDVNLENPYTVEKCTAFYQGEHRDRIQRLISQVIESQVGFDEELRISLASGDEKWVRVKCRPVLDDGILKRIRGTIQDITASYRIQGSMKMANLIYTTSREAVIVTDEKNSIVDGNPAFTEASGYQIEELFGQVPPMFRSPLHTAGFYDSVMNVLYAQDRWDGEIWAPNRQGEIRGIFATIRVVRHPSGQVYRHIIQFLDITERRRMDERIWRLENFDPVTGLPRRNILLDRAHQAIANAPSQNSVMAMVAISLDNFRQMMNDFGASQCDTFIATVVERVQDTLPTGSTLSRTEADEFSLLVSDAPDLGALESLLKLVLSEFSKPAALSESDLNGYAKVSAGIALYPNDATTPQELHAKAKLALTQAHDERASSYRFFSDSLLRESTRKAKITNDLRHAIEKNEFEVFYQPIVELPKCEVVKAEALLRWTHRQYGVVSPAYFVPLAESAGLINEIGDWVAAQVIRDVKTWLKSSDPSVQISVNKSALQLNRPGHVGWLRLLDELAVPAECIAVEITESSIMDDSEHVRRRLDEIEKAGVQISIDDFGTGFSSLAHLKNLRANYLKIDKSFVRNLATEKSDQILTASIIEMAHKFGLKTIAEGVESEAQRTILEQLGCDFAQGFLFSPPLPQAEFRALLKSSREKPTH